MYDTSRFHRCDVCVNVLDIDANTAYIKVCLKMFELQL